MALGKSTRAEIERRIEEVERMILSGMTRAAIIRECSDPEKWGITERQLQNYLRRAHDNIRAHAATNRETELGKAIARLEGLYQEAQERGLLKVALAVVHELIELLGLSYSADIARRLCDLEMKIADELAEGQGHETP